MLFKVPPQCTGFQLLPILVETFGIARKQTFVHVALLDSFLNFQVFYVSNVSHTVQ